MLAQETQTEVDGRTFSPPQPRSDFAGHRSFVAVSLLCALALLSSIGCGTSETADATASGEDARRLLQLDQAQDALDALAKLGSELTPELHYLKAIALDRLNMKKVSRNEIRLALEEEPDNEKYRCLQLRFELFGADRSAGKKLLQMYRENPSSAAVSLCAFYAMQGERIRLITENKGPEANKIHQESLLPLKTAVALSAEIPEFQRELLAFAIEFELADGAMTLIDRLLPLDPDNPILVRDQIAILLLNKQPDAAARAARTLYLKSGQDAPTAVLYAAVLENMPASERYDIAFQDLMDQHRYNKDLTLKYAAYLVRSSRVRRACDVLGATIGRLPDKKKRWELIYAAMYFPIEAKDVILAEEQLKLYRDEVPQEALVTYFEGRILLLKGKHQEAVQKMIAVIKAQKDPAVASMGLAQEAYAWIQKISQTQRFNVGIDEVLKTLDANQKPAGTAAPAQKGSASAPVSSSETNPPVGTAPATSEAPVENAAPANGATSPTDAASSPDDSATSPTSPPETVAD